MGVKDYSLIANTQVLEFYILPGGKIRVVIDNVEKKCDKILLRGPLANMSTSLLYFPRRRMGMRKAVVVNYVFPVDLYYVETYEGETYVCDLSGKEFLELH